MDLLVDFPSGLPPIAEERGKQSFLNDEESTICSSFTIPIGGLIVDFPIKTCSTILASAKANTTSAKPKPKAMPKRVLFDYRPPQINSVENYSIQYKPNIWYTESDLMAFVREKEQNVTMLRMIQRFSGKNMNDATMAKYIQIRMQKANTTPMGLENHVARGTWREMSHMREEHCNAVLVEQWKHQCDGIESLVEGVGVGVKGQDAIAKVSRGLSEWATKRAQVMGSLHADNDCRKILRYAAAAAAPTAAAVGQQELNSNDGPNSPSLPTTGQELMKVTCSGQSLPTPPSA